MHHPGMDLDSLVLRSVFGIWTIVDGETGTHRMYTEEKTIVPIPKFSTDWYAAHLLVDLWKSRGYVFRIKEDAAGQFQASFTSGTDVTIMPYAGDTEPMAICLAALAAAESYDLG